MFLIPLLDFTLSGMVCVWYGGVVEVNSTAYLQFINTTTTKYKYIQFPHYFSNFGNISRFRHFKFL